MPRIASQQNLGEIFGGVDTHKDTHTAAVVDHLGRVLGTGQFPATGPGYKALSKWINHFGALRLVGVEGTSSYGAGLTRHLQAAAVKVVEVNRPDRKTRRSQGKSDPIDAVAAARAVLSGRASAVPKDHGGPIDALAALRVARADAVQHRAKLMTRIKSMLVTAPEQLRQQLRNLSNRDLITTCTRLRAHVGDPLELAVADPTLATKVALRSMARRYEHLSQEITELAALIEPLIAALNPDLLPTLGVGIDVAGQLLVTAGDNPQRMRTEASFAALTGTSPIPASSGKTTGRHRLNRGGDRQANCALYRITLCRMRWDPRTRAYVQRRTKEGMSKPDIIRCLKRYIAREIHHTLTT